MENQTWPNQVCIKCPTGYSEQTILIKCMFKVVSSSDPNKFYWNEGHICPTCLSQQVPASMRMPTEMP